MKGNSELEEPEYDYDNYICEWWGMKSGQVWYDYEGGCWKRGLRIIANVRCKKEKGNV